MDLSFIPWYNDTEHHTGHIVHQHISRILPETSPTDVDFSSLLSGKVPPQWEVIHAYLHASVPVSNPYFLMSKNLYDPVKDAVYVGSN